MGALPHDLFMDVVKLLLGTAAFVLIGWFGARDRRIGGVLLTFPLLNGIAMLTGVDPLAIAHIVFPIVVWNSGVFLLTMYRYEVLPPLRYLAPVCNGSSSNAVIIARVAVWTAIWVTGAYLLMKYHGKSSSAPLLFGVQLVLAAAYIWQFWRKPEPAASPTFSDMWLHGTGLIRVILFVLVLCSLLAIPRLTDNPDWLGLASTMPLPGMFALALLSVTQQKKEVLLSLGDTVLLGPLLVIPFNYFLAHAMLALRAHSAGLAIEMATVIAFWSAAAALVFVVLPVFVRWRDRRLRAAKP